MVDKLYLHCHCQKWQKYIDLRWSSQCLSSSLKKWLGRDESFKENQQRTILPHLMGCLTWPQGLDQLPSISWTVFEAKKQWIQIFPKHIKKRDLARRVRPAERENQKTRKKQKTEKTDKTRKREIENQKTGTLLAVFGFSSFSPFSGFRRFRVFPVFAVFLFSPFSRFRRFRVHRLIPPVFAFSGFRVFVFTGAFTCSVLAFSCYRMDCFGTYFTHAQSCDNGRVHSTSLHTLRMPKAVITFVFIVLRNGLLRYIPYACPKLW